MFYRIYFNSSVRGAAVLEDHKSGHRNRLKAKYIENSANLVYDYEALELLLTYAIPRRDVKPIAKALLEHFGTLENVFAAKEKQLCAVNGVGQNTAVLITLVKDLQIRCAKSKNKNIKSLSSSDLASEYFENLLADQSKEKFLLVSLDNSNRLIACHTIAEGDINHIDINPRDIMETVLLDNASRVLIAHNHPAGGAEPSANDVDLTLNVRNILSSVNVKLTDHIIVGERETLSMRSTQRFSRYFTKENQLDYNR